MEKSKEKAFVLRCTEDGVCVSEYGSINELEKDIDSGNWGDVGFFGPDDKIGSPWYWGDNLLVILGRIADIEAKEVITKHVVK